MKPGDVDALAGGLKRLIDDRDRREELGAAARHAVLARYTWRTHTLRTIERLKEVVAGSARDVRPARA